MLFTILWAVLTLIVGSVFVIIWWRIADQWADEEHKRFKDKPDDGPAPTVVKRADIER
jgi:hypothetical protein